MQPGVRSTESKATIDAVAAILEVLRDQPDDEGQWRSLYRLVWPIVALQAARSLAGDIDAADDVAQESLIRVARTGRLSNFTSGRAFLVYLHITVDSVAASHLRRRRGRNDVG